MRLRAKLFASTFPRFAYETQRALRSVHLQSDITPDERC
jgi:hypothetical protein